MWYWFHFLPCKYSQFFTIFPIFLPNTQIFSLPHDNQRICRNGHGQTLRPRFLDIVHKRFCSCKKQMGLGGNWSLPVEDYSRIHDSALNRPSFDPISTLAEWVPKEVGDSKLLPAREIAGLCPRWEQRMVSVVFRLATVLSCPFWAFPSEHVACM